MNLAMVVIPAGALLIALADTVWTGWESRLLADAPREWGPASFCGLRLGEATRHELLQRFGEPDRIEDYSAESTGGHPIEWLIYDGRIDPQFPGVATFWIDSHTGQVTTVVINPVGVDRARVQEVFGSGYQVTRYSFCEEMGDGESSPIYESPSGGLELMEYRELGVSVQFDWRGNVLELTFQSRPSAITKDECLSANREEN